MNAETKNKLSYKLSTASIVLIPIAIGSDWDQLSRQIHRGRIASAALVGLDRNGIVRYVGGTGNRCRFRDHQ